MFTWERFHTLVEVTVVTTLLIIGYFSWRDIGLSLRGLYLVLPPALSLLGSLIYGVVCLFKYFFW